MIFVTVRHASPRKCHRYGPISAIRNNKILCDRLVGIHQAKVKRVFVYLDGLASVRCER